ncbi:hypothetical protein Tco_0991543 [Tanacetum coccineum]|uniref:Uncharacterized protein n=1 Tax=Tanacetum coccineum TaxID=301880 RepID=A0ABQ5EZW5_9ASTR
MDWLSKRKFVVVCHEKVVRIPLEGDEIIRVHGERTLGAAKALMSVKVDEPKLSDISVVRDFIDVFPEDLSMTTATTTNTIVEDGEQEMNFTDEELLQALDIIETPEYFIDHQWQILSHLRTPAAKKMSLNGKRARGDQKVKYKKEPNDVVFFGLAHTTLEGSFVTEASRKRQTATGKENSNPLIADSLLKTIRLSMHLVTTMKH